MPRSWAGEVGGSCPETVQVGEHMECLSKSTEIASLRLFHHSRQGALWQIDGNKFIYLIRGCSSSGLSIRPDWSGGGARFPPHPKET